MANDYFNEFIKPLNDELGDLLDRHQIPYTHIYDREECANCGGDFELKDMVWDGAYPFCSQACINAHQMRLTANEAAQIRDVNNG